jgi:hypothetical protein
VEAILDLGFDPDKPGFQCEGLVYRPDGSPVKGINPNNQWVRVADEAAGGERVELHIEAASNPCILDYHPFVPTELGDVRTARAELADVLAAPAVASAHRISAVGHAHIPVGGHRRHPDLHALPADRHLQLLDEGP